MAVKTVTIDMEAEGQGIQTIRSAMKAAGCPRPRFEVSEVLVTCILRAHPRSALAAPKVPR